VAFSFITRFLGKTTSEAAGYGIGGAIRSPLEPPLQELTNETWRAFVKSGVTIPTDPGDAAEIVAEDVALESWGADQVAQLGLGGDQFSKLVNAVRNGPGFGELLQARRRGKISADEFTHGLRKLRLEGLWDDALADLLDQLLTVADLANAVVQGHMSQDDAAAEAALQGVSGPRFDVLVQNTGLPPGPETLLAWLRRGIITQAEFETGVREGHTKVKYIPFFEAARQPLLSAATAVRLYLKGWYSKEQRDALGSEWGYSSQQMEDWFLSEGRPATVHQIHIGYARGAKLPGAANEHEAILTAVKQSDIRPEYAELLYAQRYSYPSAFVLRALVESGAVTAAEGEQALLFSGWEPTFAAKVAASWAGTGTGATADTHESKAQTQLWNTTHASYKANEISAATATQALQRAGVDAATIPNVLSIWNEEKSLIRARLQASDVRKAYRKQDENPATGAAWTRPDALAQLLSLGWSNEDAEAYLNIG
jgi:hypothetical protein